MSPGPSRRRRFAAGMVAALILGAALSQWMLARARAQENRFRASRVAVVTVSALAFGAGRSSSDASQRYGLYARPTYCEF